ncbi:hypothetical protein [Dyadobacter psychrotolerans]|uniref:hypothetical protein n=1 Tax=Dyadobacter psychrotolerans TaxID=2541721 RepID=UPI001E40C761|nr:hypothetical protein [Dyadobacter psychrotolerans]
MIITLPMDSITEARRYIQNAREILSEKAGKKVVVIRTKSISEWLGIQHTPACW